MFCDFIVFGEILRKLFFKEASCLRPAALFTLLLQCQNVLLCAFSKFAPVCALYLNHFEMRIRTHTQHGPTPEQRVAELEKELSTARGETLMMTDKIADLELKVSDASTAASWQSFPSDDQRQKVLCVRICMFSFMRVFCTLGHKCFSTKFWLGFYLHLFF